MYNDHARSLRQCKAVRKDGQPCRAWATWDSEEQLCAWHSGRCSEGRGKGTAGFDSGMKAKYAPCTCEAYAWPHRPGGGLCQWPDPPRYRRTTPAGTHPWPRVRNARDKAITRTLSRLLASKHPSRQHSPPANQ
jgi:hypothetical protein